MTTRSSEPEPVCLWCHGKPLPPVLVDGKILPGKCGACQPLPESAHRE